MFARMIDLPRRGAPWRWLLLVALLLPAGCTDHSAPPLRIGVLVWPPYEVAFLARDLGLLDGQRIEFVDYEAPAAVVRAYRDGTVDAIMVTVDYLLQLAADHPDQRAVLVIDFSDGGDVLMARPGIDGLADLRGRRIAVENSVLGAYLVQRALEQAGLALTDVEVVPADIPDQAPLYEAGRVDAVVTYEPGRTQLLRAGAHELFSSRDIPGEIVDVLVTHTATIESHGEALAAFTDAWFKAVDHLRAQPQDAASRVAAREGLTPAEYLEALAAARIPDRAENLRLLTPGPRSLSPAMERHVAVMRRMGILDRPVAVEQLIDPRFVRPR